MRHQLGVLTHALSDKLHALAHRLVGDEDWRMRNGLDPDQVMQVFESLDMSPALVRGVARLGLVWPGEEGTDGKT